MDRMYGDKVLERLATDPGYAPDGWTYEEIADFRRLDQCAHAGAPADLRALRMLGLVDAPGDDATAALATVGRNRRIVLSFSNSEGDACVTFDLSTARVKVP